MIHVCISVSGLDCTWYLLVSQHQAWTVLYTYLYLSIGFGLYLIHHYISVSQHQAWTVLDTSLHVCISASGFVLDASLHVCISVLDLDCTWYYMPVSQYQAWTVLDISLHVCISGLGTPDTKIARYVATYRILAFTRSPLLKIKSKQNLL